MKKAQQQVVDKEEKKVNDNNENTGVKENSNEKKTKNKTQSKSDSGQQKTSEDLKSEQKADKEVSKEETESISKEEELMNEVKAQKDKYLRLFAEFENYKRRTAKERIELFKTASRDLMQVMLPVLDDFDRALKEIKKSEDDSLIQGVELISNKLKETLKSKGLEPMAVKPGDTFDADLHEAVTQIPAPDKKMKGKIIDVVEKGYTLGEKIIRFPKVVTGK